ncbi:MAG: hypothetical protein ABIZ04_20945 [Opitutus sp.]
MKGQIFVEQALIIVMLCMLCYCHAETQFGRGAFTFIGSVYAVVAVVRMISNASGKK